MPVRIACGQLNQTVGDFSGNLARIEHAVADAARAGARGLLTPELSVSGYPPEDLLFRASFYATAQAALQRVAGISAAHPDLLVVVGYPLQRDGRRYDAAGVFRAGRLEAEYLKQELPNYAVFDEMRYFSPGREPLVLTVDGVRLGFAICEDF